MESFPSPPRASWYPVLTSASLQEKPKPVTVFDTAIVLFRDHSKTPQALLDRCSHRNVPLSLGRVCEGQIECGYHGWRFEGSGRCAAIPGFTGEADKENRRVPSFACREQDGLVWVYAEPDQHPKGEPYRFHYLSNPAYMTVREELDAPGSVFATVENALDVPHTAFLHGGIFRSSKRERSPVQVIIERYSDKVEARYVGEKNPPGLIGKILAPQGGEVEHIDRFLLPSVIQVEYRLGRAHFVAEAALTPVSDHQCKLFAAVSARIPRPLRPAIVPGLRAIALRIFAQDVEILQKQTEAFHQYGGLHYASTDIDIMAGPIAKLLREAQEAPSTKSLEPNRREVTMLL